MLFTIYKQLPRYSLIILGLFYCTVSYAQENVSALTLGFPLSYLSATDSLNKYTPLADYLSKTIGLPITITTNSYQAHLQLVGEDKLDLAFMSGSLYIEMVDKYQHTAPLLARYTINHQPALYSVLFTVENSPIQTLKQLIGKKVAFGEKNSNLGTKVPYYVLKSAGISLENLGGYDFLDNHRNVMYGVLLGEYDAGALPADVFDENKEKGLRILAVSPPVSSHLLVSRRTLEPALISQLQQALYTLNQQPEGKKVLSTIGANITGFVPATDSDYDSLRLILESAKQLK
ncbi:PhnD/SsuA/transferrin family substrate-binding protein [Beggiatoa leptomitoformis]|uniref:PhnD/SsuA/transferrin family substrate-binding protein n=1 Tax=Beggiatoa leptomitoformis TaxID=288004 RepID=A0A2N9YBM2_9GAMM|nr:PhnD/SsuA/transferrin family substrate-binding protein [Beggiatoa leptomitoformis]ALG66820.1 PhnD/SsuA/transferrin family substrate-binding protein [Beggiatoa leptomitoformis]AUI67829.1 PhnD/SsuA/transferrin family substrate-binding protein [Beggiatoa leptomitoformis]